MLETEFQQFSIRKICKIQCHDFLIYMYIVRFRKQACTQQKYITFTHPIVFSLVSFHSCLRISVGTPPRGKYSAFYQQAPSKDGVV